MMLIMHFTKMHHLLQVSISVQIYLSLSLSARKPAREIERVWWLDDDTTSDVWLGALS
jgi:hypothetical protein